MKSLSCCNVPHESCVIVRGRLFIFVKENGVFFQSIRTMDVVSVTDGNQVSNL